MDQISMFIAPFSGPQVVSFSSHPFKSWKTLKICFLIGREKTKPHERLQKDFSSYSK